MRDRILPSIRLVIAAAVSLTLIQVLPAKEPEIRYAFQVFQLDGSFKQKTKLKDPIWNGSSKGWDKIKGEVHLFDEGEFRSGKDRLKFSSKGCSWNGRMLTFEEGHQAKLPEKKIKMIYSPNLIRKEKELVRLKVASEHPVQFMKARKDGLFELEEVKLPTGMDIEIKAHRAGKNRYEISYLELDLRSVNRRQKMKGTTLPVGKPILDESEYILRLKIKEFRSYCILLRPEESDAMILIRFEVDDR